MSTLRWIILALLCLVLAVGVAYWHGIGQAYQRIAGKSSVIASPFGDIEYTQGGSGPMVLVVHGSGGGFDQGALIAQATVGDNMHWIAPSRFGYLRSTYHAGATFDEQAHAFAYLLDQLGVDTVAVVALSHGGPSALLFAALYPERVSSLVLVSCGVASAGGADQASANDKGNALTAIFRYDLVYWLVSQIAREPLMHLMGASDAVIAALTP